MLDMIWQWFTNLVYFIVHNVCSVLPQSPFKDVALDAPAQAIGWANWFIPFNGFIQIALIWTAAIAVYYLCMWALRLVGLID